MSFASGLAPVVLAALVWTSPAVAFENAPAPVTNRALPDEFEALRIKDARIQRLGYRLATANADHCPRTRPSIGLMLHDLALWEGSTSITQALGLAQDIAVQAVVPGGPAYGAGLAPDMGIVSAAGIAVADIPFDQDRKWSRMTALNDAIDRALDQSGSVTLELADGRAVAIEGEPACASRFEVGGIGKRAAADGKRIVIGDRFPGFSYADPELSAVLAHELAHNILAHRALFAEHGRSRKLVRATEREADRLAPWLLANAGFDPAASLRFMQAWGPDHSGGWLLRKRTHDGWDERAEMIAAETGIVLDRMRTGGEADWSIHFRREDETRAALAQAGG